MLGSKLPSFPYSGRWSSTLSIVGFTYPIVGFVYPIQGLRSDDHYPYSEWLLTLAHMKIYEVFKQPGFDHVTTRLFVNCSFFGACQWYFCTVIHISTVCKWVFWTFLHVAFLRKSKYLWAHVILRYSEDLFWRKAILVKTHRQQILNRRGMGWFCANRYDPALVSKLVNWGWQVRTYIVFGCLLFGVLYYKMDLKL